MRNLGNISLSIGLLVVTAPFSLMVFAIIVSFIFGCSGGITTEVVCQNGNTGLENLIATTTGIAYISGFWIPFILAPLILVGVSLKYLAKKLNPNLISERNKLENFNFILGKRIAQIVFLFLAIAFWWITLLIFAYLTIKNKSFKIAFSKFSKPLIG